MNRIDSEILKFLGEVKDGISSKVSPKVSASLDIESEPGIYRLLGWEWIFKAYETGRGPTENTTAGSPTLREKLEKWVTSKGITGNPKGLAYIMARKIHEQGTKLFRDGGNKGFLTDFFNESKLNNLADRIGITWKSEILEEIKTWQ